MVILKIITIRIVIIMMMMTIPSLPSRFATNSAKILFRVTNKTAF